MILKCDQIFKLLKEPPDRDDPFMISPALNIESLSESGSASLDLRLGTWFLTFRESRFPVLDIYDHIYDPKNPPPSESALTELHYVPFGRDFILHARSFALGCTLEWLRFPRDLAGYVIGKSSWGRRGLIIATATGVHPGFKGCLTLELSNVGEIPIKIRPGAQVCQLFLHEVKSDSTHVDKTKFIGQRRPRLGVIRLDDIAEKLGKPQKDT